jgi:hypothetical protein
VSVWRRAGSEAPQRVKVLRMTKKASRLLKNPPLSRSPDGKRYVASLLEALKDGQEYGSLLGIALLPGSGDALLDDVRKCVAELETIRGRPCLLYVGNMVKTGIRDTAISLNDDLPFAEMVSQVPSDKLSVDVFLATPGGLAQQVCKFVDCLRPRFTDVDFLIPHLAMSAGTIWACSGNQIWMDERAALGPIDPQVLDKNTGTVVPSQALLTCIGEIQKRGQEKLAKGEQPDWTDITILRGIDARAIGDTINSSRYSTDLAATYLSQHKFRDWVKHSTTGLDVTPNQRDDKAKEIATRLCNHAQWKTHSHGINRVVLNKELGIKIKDPEEFPGLKRAMRRLWAVLYWLFDNSITSKIMLSATYTLIRQDLALKDDKGKG